MPASSSPEDAARMTVANFVTEYIAHLTSKYALLEQAGNGPLKFSLFDFQMETFIYGLHCLDRAVFFVWGAEYRAVFMDTALDFASDTFAAVLPDQDREKFLLRFEETYRMRQLQYADLTPIVSEDGDSKNVLAYDFGERICFDAGVRNVDVIAVMIHEATSIFTMMLRIADGL